MPSVSLFTGKRWGRLPTWRQSRPPDTWTINQQTDIYGLGAILYEVLTGQPPFSGPDTHEVLRKVREEQPSPPREHWAEVPPALEAICIRALAKSPTDRFASASELATAVQSWQEVERREAQEERDRFFTLSLDMLSIAGFDGYFKRLNPAWERTLGFTLDELLAEPYLSFIHPDDRERTAAESQQILTRYGHSHLRESVPLQGWIVQVAVMDRDSVPHPPVDLRKCP